MRSRPFRAEESIAEDIFGGQDHHAAELVEGIHVKVFDFAEDTVVVYAALNVRLLEFHHVSERQRRKSLKREFRQVDAGLLGRVGERGAMPRSRALI